MVQPKTNLQKKACVLRKQGHSINQIYRQIGAAKSSVSVWVRNVVLSKEAQRRIKARWTKGQEKAWATRRNTTVSRLRDAEREAENILSRATLGTPQLQLLCALIYWCEGSKTKNDGYLTFTNSDPMLVRTFLRLLRKGFDIKEEKLRALMHLHEYHDIKQQRRFWIRVTDIPQAKFSKTYLKPHTGKRKRPNYAGCISISYYDNKVARLVFALARTFFRK